jgi:hypothetical protein
MRTAVTFLKLFAIGLGATLLLSWVALWPAAQAPQQGGTCAAVYIPFEKAQPIVKALEEAAPPRRDASAEFAARSTLYRSRGSTI